MEKKAKDPCGCSYDSSHNNSSTNSVRALPLQKRIKPTFRPAERWANSTSDTTSFSITDQHEQYQVKEFLAGTPNFVENYLLDEVDIDFLENVIAKKEAGIVRKMSERFSLIENTLEQAAAQILHCASDVQFCRVIHCLCKLLAAHTEVDLYRLYTVDNKTCSLHRYNPGEKSTYVGPIGTRLTVSAHVAAVKHSVNTLDLPQDCLRFPKGIGTAENSAHYVMCLPVLLANDRCYAVAEFTRNWDKDPFANSTFELFNMCFSWITACVQKTKMAKCLKMEAELHKFMLETTKVMFDDMDSVDLLVKHIMKFTKDLLHAERSSLFILDDRRNQIYANYFDTGISDVEAVMHSRQTATVKFDTSKGIAGYVARTGETLNIKDAYVDPRFNREVDIQTGYHTTNILCMAITSGKDIIGVVQMINKTDGVAFTDEDAEHLKSFSMYCALALQYSQIYNGMVRQKKKYQVAKELLEFQVSRLSTLNVAVMFADSMEPKKPLPEEFFSADFCCYDTDDSHLQQLYIHMIYDVFDDKPDLDLTKLCRFVMCVRRGYRPVAYHNWQHAFHVAHSLWIMIRESKTMQFTRMEKIALIVAGLCHDLDHRGYNNDFYKNTHHPFAALYGSSTMEQHHYLHTLAILHADGTDIFNVLSSEDHATVVGMIRKNIIATDLALLFGNNKFIMSQLADNTFDPVNVPQHRDAMLALMMTAADMCAVVKPWATLTKTVMFLYEEFYDQGDEEKKLGLKPLTTFDRNFSDTIPQQQETFLDNIVMPMYQTLAHLLPETRAYVDGCRSSREHWKMEHRAYEAKKTTIKMRNS